MRRCGINFILELSLLHRAVTEVYASEIRTNTLQKLLDGHGCYFLGHGQ